MQIICKENLRILCKENDENFLLKNPDFFDILAQKSPFLNTLHRNWLFTKIWISIEIAFTRNKTKSETQFHCIHNFNWGLQDFETL